MITIKNTVEGFLTNVEIKGNTAQDSAGSVGDKVGKQELYKIDILCTNGLEESNPQYQEYKASILSPTPLEKVEDMVDRIIEKDGVWGVEKNVTKKMKESKTSSNSKQVAKNARFIPLPDNQQVKLKSFSGNTKISFLTKVKGTIKADVPKSLGATVKSNTKAIQGLNKDLERVKKLEKATAITITTENDFITIKETSNGYFDNIKLEGRTLVVNSKNEEALPGAEGAVLKSVGDGADEITVLSVNENLFDGNILQGAVLSGGSITNDKNSLRTDYVNCKGLVNISLNYVLNGNINDNLPAFFDKDKKFISMGSGNKEKTYKVPDNACYVIFRWFRGEDILVNELNDVIISVGTTPRTYTPHKLDKKKVLYYDTETQTWKKPILREWDSVEKHADGKYYYHKRSGEAVLNGSEEWIHYSNNNLETYSAKASHLKEMKPLGLLINNELKYIPPEDNIYMNDVEGISITETSVAIRVSKSKLLSQDIEGIKKWLQANNVIIVYQLVKEEVYECAPIDLTSFESETSYGINCGLVTPKTTLKCQNYIGNIINTLKEKVSNLEDKLYKTNLANFTVALNTLDTKLKLEQLTKTPR